MKQFIPRASVTFEMSFQELTRLLGELHSIRADKASAFSARLKDFQRRGFPPGVNTGKGRAAKYGPEAFTKLVLAVELSQLGMGPERIISVIRQNYDLILHCVRFATKDSFMDDSEERVDWFIYLDPWALAELSDLPTNHDISTETFFYAHSKALAERLLESKGKNAFQRMALINVSQILGVSFWIAVQHKIKGADQFLESIYEWSLEADPYLEVEPDGSNPQA